MIEQKPGESPFTSAVFTIAAQVGCLTFSLIIVALIAGLLIDKWLETLPLFTILFLVGSMPLSWVMVFWIVNRAKSKFTAKPAGTSASKHTVWEDEDSDTDK